MVLSCTIFELFDVEKYHGHEIQVRDCDVQRLAVSDFELGMNVIV